MGLLIVADDGGVEVGIAVDLRPAEKADGDPPALQPVAEHLGDRHGGQRRIAELAVADRQRQHLGLGVDRPRLVDQRDAGGMGEPRQVAGRRRRADADEADIVIAQRPRRRDRHDLGRGVGLGRAVQHVLTLSSEMRADRMALFAPLPQEATGFTEVFLCR